MGAFVMFRKQKSEESLLQGPWILLNDQRGRRFIPGVRVAGGYVSGEAYYPDEFLEPIPGMGGEVVQLAEYMTVPSSGDFSSHDAEQEMMKLGQVGFMAHWSAFCRARKRLVWESLYEAGDGTRSMMKTFTSAFVIITCLVVFWQSFGLKGKVGELADTNRLNTATMQALGKEMERLQERPQAQVNVVGEGQAPIVEPTTAPAPTLEPGTLPPTALPPGAVGGLPAVEKPRRLRKTSPYATATPVNREPGGVGSGPCAVGDFECKQEKEKENVER
jgi:hypothetical protein